MNRNHHFFSDLLEPYSATDQNLDHYSAKLSQAAHSVKISHNQILNDPFDLLLVSMNASFWLTVENCKKHPKTNKGIPPNGNGFCMIATKDRSERSKDLKTFKY